MEGVTPLFAAAQEGHEGEEVKCFLKSLDKCLKINQFTPRLFADAVEVLLDARADPNAARNDGETPLGVALERGHFAVAEMLVRGERRGERYVSSHFFVKKKYC